MLPRYDNPLCHKVEHFSFLNSVILHGHTIWQQLNKCVQIWYLGNEHDIWWTCLSQMACICHFFFFYILPRASYGYIQYGFISSVVGKFSDKFSSYFRCGKLALTRETSYIHIWIPFRCSWQACGGGLSSIWVCLAFCVLEESVHPLTSREHLGAYRYIYLSIRLFFDYHYIHLSISSSSTHQQLNN